MMPDKDMMIFWFIIAAIALAVIFSAIGTLYELNQQREAQDAYIESLSSEGN